MARQLGRYARKGFGNPPLTKDYVVLKSYEYNGNTYYKGSFSYGGMTFSISTNGVSMPSTRNDNKEVMFCNVAVFKDNMKYGR